MDEKKSIDEMLEEQRREKAALYARSVDGQKEFIKELRRRLLKEHEDCRTSVVTVARWIDDQGQKHSSVMNAIGGSWPPEAFVESNQESRRERLTKLTEIIAVCDAMFSQLGQLHARPLPEDYRATLERLKAEIPDRNVMEIVRAPKPAK